MKYDVIIDQKLFDIYPEIRLGLLRFKTNIESSNEQFWLYMNTEVIPNVKKEIEGKQWSEISGVRGSRLAYKAFGRGPGRYRVSSEALLRRIRRGDDLYHINSIVDVNNLISIKSGLSVGSYDLNKVDGTIQLKKAEQGEGYDGIGKKYLDMRNILVLVDNQGAFGSSMSDSTRSMVINSTKDVLVVVYCFENDICLETLLEEGKKAFEKFAIVEDIEGWII
ncbi:MAG: phenylalanine--tRNA ligase beta subunit-related protein [Bacillota bacterium]|nr:phenylalanine--tRNA ligase beta subunit-related protein [Bacillota bacterium]